VNSNALNTPARKEWRKSVAIQLVSMASDQPYSQTQEPEAPKKQETSTTEPNNFEDEEKELKHCSLQEKLDNELKELDKRPEQKEAEMKRVAGGDTSVLKQHYENSPSWPCFTLVMKALDLKQLYLPKFFSKKLHLKKVKKKGLVVKKNGKEWRIKIYHWEKKNSYFFYGGWPKFIKDNDVTVGDRLKIELVGPELKVSVLRCIDHKVNKKMNLFVGKTSSPFFHPHSSAPPPHFLPQDNNNNPLNLSSSVLGSSLGFER
ncbi:kinesin-like protein KIN-4C, partial [Tanacetum coccineum]